MREAPTFPALKNDSVQVELRLQGDPCFLGESADLW